jgi:hypothetical protein
MGVAAERLRMARERAISRRLLAKCLGEYPKPYRPSAKTLAAVNAAFARVGLIESPANQNPLGRRASAQVVPPPRDQKEAL